VGAASAVDSLKVHWPDGRIGRNIGVEVDTLIVLHQRDARPDRDERPSGPGEVLFTDVTDASKLDYLHMENAFVDFDRERLIPKMVSIEGPRIATGDVNRDGLTDVYLGGAKDAGGRLLLQLPGGDFESLDDALFEEDRISEDVDALFFDADGDGDDDLYVGSGGTEYSRRAPAFRDRLYLNDGSRGFRREDGALPPRYQSTSTVAASDFDRDGDLDLFVGSRVIPFQYGHSPESAVLRNDGGTFSDVTQEVAPDLRRVGMVTDAVWADYTGDGLDDLIVVGDWMAVELFQNKEERLVRDTTITGLEHSYGMWNCVVATDIDDDGDVDLVAGNLGLNSQFRASVTAPVRMYVSDFDASGWVEQILSVYRSGVEHPFVVREELINQLPTMAQRYATHREYAGRSISDVLTLEQLDSAVVERLERLETTLIRNKGSGRFEMLALPRSAQWAPVFGILPGDFDGDLVTDLVLVGNFFGFATQIGRLDGNYGTFLRGLGDGLFEDLPSAKTGFHLSGQGRDIATILGPGNQTRVLVSRNNDRPLLFEMARSVGSRR
jgi:hypothetical protein